MRMGLLIAVPCIAGILIIGGGWDTVWETLNHKKKLKKIEVDKEERRTGRRAAEGRSL